MNAIVNLHLGSTCHGIFPLAGFYMICWGLPGSRFEPKHFAHLAQIEVCTPTGTSLLNMYACWTSLCWTLPILSGQKEAGEKIEEEVFTGVVTSSWGGFGRTDATLAVEDQMYTCQGMGWNLNWSLAGKAIYSEARSPSWSSKLLPRRLLQRGKPKV